MTGELENKAADRVYILIFIFRQQVDFQQIFQFLN